MTRSVLRLFARSRRAALGRLALGAVIGCIVTCQADADLRHNYLFNSGDGTQVLDSEGTAHGTALGTAMVDTGSSRLVTTFGANGTSYAELPAGDIAINTFPELTLEQWLTVSPSTNNWAWSAAFGRQGDAGAMETAGNGYDYFMFNVFRAPADQGSRAAITPNTFDLETGVTNGAIDLNDGSLHHIVATVSDTNFAYYVDGVQIGDSVELPQIDDGMGGMKTLGVEDLANDFAYIGRSLYNADSDMGGSVFEYRIYDNALTAEEVTSNFNAGCLDSCGEGARLLIDRATGEATFANDLAATGLVRYSLTSEAGALDPDGWAPITENGDQNNGGTIDDTDNWEIVTQTVNDLTEQDPIGQGDEDGAVFGPDIPLGNVWQVSPFEDVVATIITYDGSMESQPTEIPVRFINGEPLSLADLNRDGSVDGTDYDIHKANHLQTLAADNAIDSQQLGDLDGDLDNDHADFVLFKNEFIAANGAAAFAALGVAVPEPGSAVLLLGGIAAAGVLGRRRVSSKAATAGAALALAVVLSASSAQAAVVSFSPTAPTPGDNDLFNLTGAATDTGNVYDPATGPPEADGAANDGATYVAFDRMHQGQTFTTGSGGGFVNAVWLQHAGYTENTDLTYYNTAPGSVFRVRLTDPAQAGSAGFALDDESYTTTGTEPDSLSPGGAANSANGTGTWVRFAFETPLEVAPNTTYGFDVTATATAFFETLGSSEDNYAGGVAYNGDTVAMPDDVLNELTGDRVFLVEVRPTPETVTLVVNTVTGAVSIRNELTAPLAFDYYRIDSPSDGSLLTADYSGGVGWDSLSDQQRDAIGAGAGETWDEVTDAVSANRLVEEFLLGATTLTPGQSASLGAPYDLSVMGDDLEFQYASVGGGLSSGRVVFTDVVGGNGDFNSDGVVDARDYALWRDNLGGDEAALGGAGDGSGTVDAGDYALWTDNYGAAPASGASAVPEPSAAALVVFAVVIGVSSPKC